MKNICRHICRGESLFVIVSLFTIQHQLLAEGFQTNIVYGKTDVTFTISGTVKNNGGTPFEGAEVQAINSSTGLVVASAVTNGSGIFTLTVLQGTYDIKAIPPAGSGFTPTILIGQSIMGSTIIDFVLVPSGVCMLSGKITDRDGNPIDNQPVQLSGFIGLMDTTDASGNYSFTASPGTYTFTIPSSPGNGNPHLPQQFYLWANDLVLSGNTILNVRLPNVSLAVTVLDLANNPVPGTILGTELAMTSTTFSAGSVMFHGNLYGAGITDSSGHALIWMFPTTTNIRVVPPATSGFAPMRFDTVSIQADTVVTVHLVPAITLSGKIADRDGNPIDNQPVQLSGFIGLMDTTDASGNYSFTASPGTYTFTIPSSPGNGNPHLPQQFYLWANDLVLSGNTILNVRLPNVSLAVTVLDLANNPVPGTILGTELAMTSTTFSAGSVMFHGNLYGAGVTDSSGHALIWMFPTTTNIRVVPPATSGFAPMRFDTVSIQADTVVTVHLVPAITLSGKIADRDGNPIDNQPVQLSGFIGLMDTTDASGNYSFTASPGTYTFTIPSSPGNGNPHLPQQFYLWANDLVLSGNTILNVRLPNVSLAVTVLDLANNPVPGTILGTELAMTSTTFSAGSVMFHGNLYGAGVTDSSGHALIWMFPTTTNIRVVPPATSGFAPIIVDSFTVFSDKSMVIHLESVAEVKDGASTPTQFMLLQNYPNPFNPTTTIEYALPVSGFVRITVFDIAGREAAVLVNEYKEGGRWYTITCDMNGLSAGVYFYHMQVGTFQETRKLILLK